MIVLDRLLPMLLSLLSDLQELFVAVGFCLFHLLLMALCVRFIPPFLQNKLGILFQFVLDGLFPHSFDFLYAILLAFQHPFRLDDLPALVFHKKGLDSVVRVDRVLTCEKVTLRSRARLVRGHTFGSLCMCRRVNRGKLALGAVNHAH